MVVGVWWLSWWDGGKGLVLAFVWGCEISCL